jgi:hypothetical protein
MWVTEEDNLSLMSVIGIIPKRYNSSAGFEIQNNPLFSQKR